MRRWQIEQWVLDPVAVQREVLQDLVTSAQYTEIGRKYNFSKLFSIKEFKKAVPIHEYDDLKPYIQRIMQGEENLLWNTPINWFAKSSGTTSDKSKFIPVSEESLITITWVQRTCSPCTIIFIRIQTCSQAKVLSLAEVILSVSSMQKYSMAT
jgi:hypothetical protein